MTIFIKLEAFFFLFCFLFFLKKGLLMPEDCNHTRTIFQLSYETDVSLLHIEETEITWLPHRLA